MAYVRKTDMLVDSIKSQVRHMKDKAVHAVEPASIDYGTAIFDATVTAINKAAFREAPELEGKLPPSWLTKHSHVNVHFLSDAGDKLLKTSLSAPDHAEIALPPSVKTAYYHADVEVRHSECPEVLKTWLDEANKRETEVCETKSKFDLVERQLTEFMSQHASLNAAIKEMPEIEMYVPNQYMVKLREPSTPRSNKKSDQRPSNIDSIGIDRDHLAAMAVAHRIVS